MRAVFSKVLTLVCITTLYRYDYPGGDETVLVTTYLFIAYYLLCTTKACCKVSLLFLRLPFHYPWDQPIGNMSGFFIDSISLGK